MLSSFLFFFFLLRNIGKEKKKRTVQTNGKKSWFRNLFWNSQCSYSQTIKRQKKLSVTPLAPPPSNPKTPPLLFCLATIWKYFFNIPMIKIGLLNIVLDNRILEKSRNQHALEMESQPPHLTFMPHQMDFS